jgi:hypothetical protein
MWLHTSKALYKVACVEEDRLIWHAYLEKALDRGLTPSERNGDNKDNENAQVMFSQALIYCKNDQDRSTVLQYQAEHFLLNGKPLIAAQYYARSDADFDVVILRLLNMISPSGIHVYVSVHICTDLYVCMYVYAHRYVYIYICMYICTHILYMYFLYF